ncbi:DUF5362 family protein [uncultured Chitinophaga sp.]|uniref:DUF5362 family protein n=1 Tax=uncultured Chitinophaga sp. TaxID=339340 RepID=UPI0025D833A7|nr:DUF5362 family protein [uncultured Chitinophaga sp.]
MDQQLFDLRVDEEVSSYLGQTARWAKFIAVAGFVMCGFLFIAAFFVGTLMTAYSEAYPGGAGVLTAIYVVLAVVMFVPYLYLYNFASKMQKALQSVDQHTLAKSFANLKSCFKFIGIATIIMLAMYALVFIGGVAAGIMKEVA